MPRELSDRHVIGVTLTGWMAHAKDRMFQEIYVDRDIGQWGECRASEDGTSSGTSYAGRFLVQPRSGRIGCPLPNQALGTLTAAEAWYQAPPGCTIAKIRYRGTVASAGWLGARLRRHGLARDALSRRDPTRRRLMTRSGPRRSPPRTVRPHQTYSSGTSPPPSARRERQHLQARGLRQPRPHDPDRRHQRTGRPVPLGHPEERRESLVPPP
jgi:hypothetical protein